MAKTPRHSMAELLRESEAILRRSCLENGAIVAANSIDPLYGKETKNYFYIWPRDAAFSCMALDALGVSDPQEKFFDWLMERAEGWQETGLLYEKYYVNGLQALNRFQPDQTGTVLFAVAQHFSGKKLPEKYKKLVKHSADALCAVWQKTHFSLVTNDLWEERHTFPDLQENFTYSLAACSAGLLAAHKLMPNKKYAQKATEMKTAILGSAVKLKRFGRSSGRINDERIDASLLGLVWPFAVMPADAAAMKNTIRDIERILVFDGGVHRYEHDEYDGWMYNTMHRKKGAGFWPLLNFWLAIVLQKSGNTEKALQYFSAALPKSGMYIPEQIFPNVIQKSVSPLAWSHAMFIFAAKELKA